MLAVTGEFFEVVLTRLIREMGIAPIIHTGEWQSIDTSTSEAHATHELTDVILEIFVQNNVEGLQAAIRPDLPWAEEHFQERVSGYPMNPPPSHVNWPHARRGNGDHINGGKFDHTYPERFWPCFAGEEYDDMDTSNSAAWEGRMGIRFHYGDLEDVVSLLAARRHTRQAYLPVWFPEDTGGSTRLNARVPCSLGYHFMIRNDILSCRYFIRSCDLVRHFTNDVYLAARLMQWMAEQVTNYNGRHTVHTGKLVMVIGSLHAMVGDAARLRDMMHR